MSSYTITIAPDDQTHATTTVRVEVGDSTARITELLVRAGEGEGLSAGQLPAINLDQLLRAVAPGARSATLAAWPEATGEVATPAPEALEGATPPRSAEDRDPASPPPVPAIGSTSDAGSADPATPVAPVPTVAEEPVGIAPADQVPAGRDEVDAESVTTARHTAPAASARRTARKGASPRTPKATRAKATARKAAPARPTKDAAGNAATKAPTAKRSTNGRPASDTTPTGRRSTTNKKAATASKKAAAPRKTTAAAKTTAAKTTEPETTGTRATRVGRTAAKKATTAKKATALGRAASGKATGGPAASGRSYRRSPADLARVMSRTGSVTAVAEHYGVPRYTVNSWLRTLRRNETGGGA
nr:hypothetical protein [Micromonospora sp. DSM 115978]